MTDPIEIPDEAKPAAPRRGRPRDPERRARLLEAAKDAFLEQGFERTSMEDIAARSGVSKMTLYNYFASKEALFEVMIAEEVDRFFFFDERVALDPRRPRESLERLGRMFVQLLRKEDVLCQHRVLFSLAGQQPEICEAFFRNGPCRVLEQVAAYLAAAHAAGSLRADDPQRLADQFLALHLGIDQYRGLLGLTKPTPAQDRALVARNVDLLMRACELKPDAS